jgi:hypothetical protein
LRGGEEEEEVTLIIYIYRNGFMRDWGSVVVGRNVNDLAE